MSFISAIHTRFKGSGISELLVAADIIAEGSVDQALRGKHYQRSLRCMKLLYEALTRRVLQHARLNGLLISPELHAQLDQLRSFQSEEEIKTLYNKLESNPELATFIHQAFDMTKNTTSPMAAFWLSFMDMVEILFMNIHALRTQDWAEFKDSLRLMLPWLHVYDRDKYGKWLLHFWLDMCSLPEEHGNFMRDGLFSQSMTGNPYSCLPLDMWIEMTMNKGSKMKAGWSSILKNEAMLLIHTRNANFINRVRDSLHTISDLAKSSKCHSENTKTRLRQDEQAAQDLDACITEFGCDPFDLTNTVLRSLQSGLIASKELVLDLETAHKDGHNLVNKFFEDRMFSNKTPFDATIHRNKRHTFNRPSQTKDRAISLVKTDYMENKAMSDIIILAEKCQERIDLEHIMEHRVTEECLPIFNINGTIRKGQKSKLLEKLNFVELSTSEQYIALVDMGFIWRLATPSTEDREKRDGSSFTWGDYAQKIFNIICTRHAQASEIIMVNDPYDVPINIKDCEHERRMGDKQYTGTTPNVFMRKNDMLPPSHEFNSMFKNSDNKIRLQQFLKTELTVLAEEKPDVKFVYSLRNKCWNLSSGFEVPAYQCQHMEADTIVFYIYSQMRKAGVNDIVIIDAEDTDVVVLAAYATTKVTGALGIRRRNKIYNCKLLDDSNIIVQLHIFTGADATAAFFGQGKKTVYDKVMKSEDAKKMLETLGSELPVSPASVQKRINFTIKHIYNDKSSKTLGAARAGKWKRMK